MGKNGGVVAKALWLTVGAVVFCVAGVALFILGENWLSTSKSAAAALAGMVVVPVVAAALLTPALRRSDPEARFGSNAVGLAGLWAILVLLVIGIFARTPLASALESAPTRHPDAGPSLRAMASAAARALAPSPPSPSTQPTSSAVPTAASAAASATAGDAGTRPPPPTPQDAGRPPTGGDGDAAAPESGDPVVFAEVAVDDIAFDVQTADLDGDSIDEILVKTLERVHVLKLGPKGTLVDLLLFAPTPPANMRVAAGKPGVGDANHDGKADVLLCATYQSQGGGTRGGQTWFAPWKEGGFGDLVVLEGAPCMAVAMGDVTGDGQAELLIAHTGNPWQKEQPNGEVAWRSRAGKQWAARGRLPTSIYPDGLTLVDVTGDAILDVIVSHGWDHGDPTVLLVGGKTGLRAAPAGTPAPAEPDKARAPARFDDDKLPDAAVLVRGRLQLLRTRPLAGPIINHIEPGAQPVPPPPPSAPAPK